MSNTAKTVVGLALCLVLGFLAGGAWILGTARLTNVFNAENDAYAQAVAGRGFGRPLLRTAVGLVLQVLDDRLETIDLVLAAAKLPLENRNCRIGAAA